MPSLQLRRGLSTNRTNITPAEGELIFTTDTSTLYVGDGTTAGGVIVAGQTSGTVTSVGVSGGTTGLSTSGGPVTDRGTITLSGTLNIANGGTGQTTANDAFNALAPNQSGNSGKYLTTNGTSTSWANIGLGLIVYVTKTGNDSTGDGSITNPFATISAALSYANTTWPANVNNTSSVAIMFGPGSYSENLTITRPCTHLVGHEGKQKGVFISGNVVINPSLSYGGVFNTSFTLTNLFLASVTGNVIELAGTIQSSVDINNCVLYAFAAGKGFTVTNNASGGNRIRIVQTDITIIGNGQCVDLSNILTAILSIGTYASASTSEALKISASPGPVTINNIQVSTASATNVLTILAGTVNVGYSAITNTKANGNGVSIAAGATYVASGTIYNVIAGTGKAVTGSAGSIYLRGGNSFLYGTNNSIDTSITTLSNNVEVAGTDINSAVPTSVGGTGLTTFTAANRAIYSTSASALTAGTLPVAAGGTGGTTASTAINNLFSEVTSVTLGSAASTSVGATTTLVGASNVSGTNPYPGNIVIAGGTQSLTSSAAAGSVTIAGGGNTNNGSTGGSVILQGGQGDTAGVVSIQTHSGAGGSRERLRITGSGAWSVGTSGTDYGTSGQMLTSNGNAPPTWQTFSGVTSVNVSGGTTGLSTSGGPVTTSGTITLAGTLAVANGGTGSTTAAGARTNLSAAASGANSDITSLSNVTSIVSSTANSILIEGGASITTNGTAGSVVIKGGTASGGGAPTAGNVILQAGDSSSYPGYVSIQTRGAAGQMTERLRIYGSSGAWSVGSTGAEYGTSGQVLTSNGGAAPTWQTISAVTSINVSGGTTGLTTSGGPVTSTGTVTLAGTLAATNGGTGQSSWTTGDLLYASGTNTLSKLSIGTANQVLTVVSGVPTWAAAAGGGGGSSDASTLTGSTLASNVVNSSLTSVGTLSSLTLSGALTFGANYTETRTSVTAASSTALNCSLGNIFSLTMSASISTLSFSNVPATGRAYSMTLFVNQDATGNRTISWPAEVRWPGGTAPTLTTTANKTDIITLVTHDGGTNWYGLVAGQNY